MDDEAAVLWVDEDVLVLCEAAKGFVDRDARAGDDSGARGRGGRVGGEDKEAEAGGEDDEGRRVVSLWEGCTRESAAGQMSGWGGDATTHLEVDGGEGGDARQDGDLVDEGEVVVVGDGAEF